MPTLKLYQLLAADPDDLSPAPAAATIWLNPDCMDASDPSHPKLVGVALIEGKYKEDGEIVFDATKVEPEEKMHSTVNSVAVEHGVKDVVFKKVDPRCPNASNPYHVCTDYCSERMKEGRKSGNATLIADRKDVHPNCVNASNPFHKCSEYCLEKMREMDSPKGRKFVSSFPKSKANLTVVERKDVDPNCVNASNPYHKCTDYCLGIKQEINSQPGRKSVSSAPESNGKFNMVERKDVNPNCVNASNPYHKCTGYCLERLEMDSQKGRKSVSSAPKGNGKFNMVERKGVNPNCVNASNPFHNCTEYCLEREQMDSQQGRKSVSSSAESNGKFNMVERKDVNPNCANASNPFHKCTEYCLQREQMDSQQGRKSDSSPKVNGNLAMAERKDVDPNCVNASNPYHKCAEYCRERKQETNGQQGRKSVPSSPKSKVNLAIVERKDVDPNCVNASNPFHKCAEYCLKRKYETDSQEARQSVSSLPKSMEKLVLVERKDVNPNCLNASNPYHKCDENCLKMGQETVRSLGRKSVSSSSPQGNGKVMTVERKDVVPNCINASNPYHKCAEYCSPRIGAVI